MKQILCLLFAISNYWPGKLAAQKTRLPGASVKALVDKTKADLPASASGKAKTRITNKPVAKLFNKATKLLPMAKGKPKETLKIVSRPKQRIDETALKIANMQGQLQWPLAVCTITEGFGHTDMGSYTLYNPGLTFTSPAPVTARACYDAVVEHIVQIENNYTVLASYNGIYFGYSNLSDVQVKKGDQLKKGHTIGTLGLDDEGRYALLLLIQVDNREVNPKLWFTKDVMTEGR